MINNGLAILNIITNSRKLYFTRIFISIRKDENAKQKNIGEKQKPLLNFNGVWDMLVMSFKRNSKLNFQMQIQSEKS